MSSFWKPNLERPGRLLRGILGVSLLVGGVVALSWNVWAGAGLLASAALVLFEAMRGWCVMRACGIKTRI